MIAVCDSAHFFRVLRIGPRACAARRVGRLRRFSRPADRNLEAGRCPQSPRILQTLNFLPVDPTGTSLCTVGVCRLRRVVCIRTGRASADVGARVVLFLPCPAEARTMRSNLQAGVATRTWNGRRRAPPPPARAAESCGRHCVERGVVLAGGAVLGDATRRTTGSAGTGRVGAAGTPPRPPPNAAARGVYLRCRSPRASTRRSARVVVARRWRSSSTARPPPLGPSFPRSGHRKAAAAPPAVRGRL